MKIVNHRLEGEGITIHGSPNRGGALEPDSIVIHYTAGPTAESAIRTLTDPNKKVSAHLVIARDGGITQLVPFNAVAWHAGKSSYDGRSGFNKYAIGIEIVNAGRLTKSDNLYLAWFGKAYQEDEVMFAVHRNEHSATYWHRYSEEQIAITEEICSLLRQDYPITHILGHEEISPNRKIDPGPAFPLDKLREKILEPNRDQDEADELPVALTGNVIPEKLNIRTGPSVQQGKVARPLPKGKKVKILEKSDDWYRVAVEIEGWVSGQYIELEK
ncbi:MAG: N-acetylmuramoyl-L-alanine amidase [bacterium]